MSETDIRSEARSVLAALLRGNGDVRDFADSDSLIVSGRLSSIDTLEIVLFLERRCGIDFAETGFDQRLLDTVDDIVALAEGAGAKVR